MSEPRIYISCNILYFKKSYTELQIFAYAMIVRVWRSLIFILLGSILKLLGKSRWKSFCLISIFLFHFSICFGFQRKCNAIMSLITELKINITCNHLYIKIHNNLQFFHSSNFMQNFFSFILSDLVHCTNEPNVSIPHLANLLVERTQNANWVVVYKSLLTVHHLLAYGNEVSGRRWNTKWEINFGLKKKIFEMELQRLCLSNLFWIYICISNGEVYLFRYTVEQYNTK